jgi:hypothetical protein
MTTRRPSTAIRVLRRSDTFPYLTWGMPSMFDSLEVKVLYPGLVG